MEHEWGFLRLVHDKQVVVTYFSWICNGCLSKVDTFGDGHIGSHGSWAYKPSDSNLLNKGFHLDCQEQMVKNIIIC